MNRKVDRVVIRGSGVSALCCAKLLANQPITVQLISGERPYLPAVVLSETTAELLCSIFGSPAILEGARRLHSRHVIWSGEPALVPEVAFVIPEELLLRRFRRIVDRDCGDRARESAGGEHDNSCIVIYADGSTHGARAYRFGRQRAALTIEPLAGESPACSTMRADADGWRFTVPVDDRGRLVQTVRAMGSPGQACAPRLSWPVAGAGWFRCGPAAMAVDPICGDGVGYATRSALWVSALVRALHDGADPNEVSAHYNYRIALALQEHLGECLRLYLQAPFCQLWRRNIQDGERGFAALQQLTSRNWRPAWRLDSVGANADQAFSMKAPQ